RERGRRTRQRGTLADQPAVDVGEQLTGGADQGLQHGPRNLLRVTVVGERPGRRGGVEGSAGLSAVRTATLLTITGVIITVRPERVKASACSAAARRPARNFGLSRRSGG